jgi:predicted MFS family arabinose efflux permease
MNQNRTLPSPAVTIILITTAHFFHHQLTALVVPLLPFMRDGLELSYARAGTLVSAFALSYGFGQLPAGWLADRIGPRYLLLAGISGVALAGALVGLTGTYGSLVVFLVAMGLLGGGYHPAATPAISNAVPPAQRGRAMGIHLVGGSASHLVAPLLGVALATALGWRGAFLTISVPVFLFGTALFVFFRHADPVPRVSTLVQEESSSRDSASPESPAVPIALFVAITSIAGAFVASVIAFVPLYLVDEVGMTQGGAALALALFFSAGLWAAPLGGVIADRVGTVAVFTVAVGLVAPLIILIGIVPSAVYVISGLVLLGATMFVRMVVSESYLIGVVAPARRSTVLGIYFFAGMEGSGVITPLLGAMIDRFGFSVAFSVAGGVVFIALFGLTMIALVRQQVFA